MADQTFINRDRGILSKADREFLLGEKELKAESARQTRQRIRNRIKNSLIDFTALRYSLEERDRKLIGDDLFRGKDRLWHGYIDMYAFFYILNDDFGHSLHWDLKQGIEEAENQLHEEEGESIKVDLDFEVRKQVVHEYDDLWEKFNEGGSLTPEEMQDLLFESEHFGTLGEEEKWDKFADFLSGDLDVRCEIDQGPAKVA